MTPQHHAIKAMEEFFVFV